MPRPATTTQHAGREQLRIAQETARLMRESGYDFAQARRKAAARLGIHDESRWPRRAQVEDALREQQRLFDADQPSALQRRRETALQALDFFARFQPRLAGAVLDGTAGTHAPVLLHLHADDPDAVARFLDEAGIPMELRDRHVRLERNRAGRFPAWQFSAEGIAFELLVLPLAALHHAPLADADEKPMKRASRAQLQQLLAASGEHSPPLP